MDVGILEFSFSEKLDARWNLELFERSVKLNKLLIAPVSWDNTRNASLRILGNVTSGCWKFSILFSEKLDAMMELFERSMKLKKLLIAFHGITQGTRLCAYWGMSQVDVRIRVFYHFFEEIKCVVVELFERSVKLNLLIAFQGITQGTRFCVYWAMSSGCWNFRVFYHFFEEIRCAELFERSVKLNKLLIAFHGTTQGTRILEDVTSGCWNFRIFYTFSKKLDARWWNCSRDR